MSGEEKNKAESETPKDKSIDSIALQDVKIETSNLNEELQTENMDLYHHSKVDNKNFQRMFFEIRHDIHRGNGRSLYTIN